MPESQAANAVEAAPESNNSAPVSEPAAASAELFTTLLNVKALVPRGD